MCTLRVLSIWVKTNSNEEEEWFKYVEKMAGKRANVKLRRQRKKHGS